jgi:hypothetical protein
MSLTPKTHFSLNGPPKLSALIKVCLRIVHLPGQTVRPFRGGPFACRYSAQPGLGKTALTFSPDVRNR